MTQVDFGCLVLTFLRHFQLICNWSCKLQNRSKLNCNLDGMFHQKPLINPFLCVSLLQQAKMILYKQQCLTVSTWHHWKCFDIWLFMMWMQVKVIKFWLLERINYLADWSRHFPHSAYWNQMAQHSTAHWPTTRPKLAQASVRLSINGKLLCSFQSWARVGLFCAMRAGNVIRSLVPLSLAAIARLMNEFCSLKKRNRSFTPEPQRINIQAKWKRLISFQRRRKCCI